jgi:hypothetical protein
MAKYEGPRTECHDCGKSAATENLGKRAGRGKGPLTLVCSGCADARLGRVQPNEDNSQQMPNRSASFVAGHQKEDWWQPELGQ